MLAKFRSEIPREKISKKLLGILYAAPCRTEHITSLLLSLALLRNPP